MHTIRLQGSIGPSELPDILLSLQASSSTGRLRLQRDGIARDLYLRSGILIAADSSADTDSLEWLLFTAGVLTEERHEQVRGMIESGVRRGRALLESGSLSPDELCEWTARRARFLARDALAWRSGTFGFEDGASPPAGSIAVAVDPRDVLISALREGPAAALSARLPPPHLVPEQPPAGPPGSPPSQLLLPHEAYVLSLADGRRKVSEICSLSEIGEAETLRVLALLMVAGCLHAAGGPASSSPRAGADEGAFAPDLPPPSDLPAGDSTAEIRIVMRTYNELYGFICAHMIREVGPIAEQLLEKNLREVRDLHAALFSRVVAGRDGSLPEEALLRNVNLIKDQNRRELLVTGLHDYLRAMVLAVRRILGADHEARLLRKIREVRCPRT